MKMPVNKTTLKNGVRILTQNIPYVRSVSVGVWVAVGARDESSEENGLSHFIEHMIFKGTTRRTAFRIAKEFDAIGGHTNAFTALETTCYHARVMDTHLETMTDILSDIFLNSVFSPDELERERPVILQEVGMVEDTPDDYIHVLSEQAFWGDHPLGRSVLGSRENILGFDAETLREFMQRLYQPERIVIAAAGNLEHSRFTDLMGPAFEAIRPGNGFPERTFSKGCSGLSVHERDLEQLHICLEAGGIPINDPRRYAASLLNTILGGNMSSRLFQEIREQRGLAYSVYSFLSSYADSGVSGIYVGTGPEDAAEAVGVMANELKRLKNAPVSPSELQDAKEFSKGGLLLSSESMDNRMFRLAQNEIYQGGYTPVEEIITRIDAVTTEEILALAQTLFKPDPMTLTLLGPVSDAEILKDILQDI